MRWHRIGDALLAALNDTRAGGTNAITGAQWRALIRSKMP